MQAKKKFGARIRLCGLLPCMLAIVIVLSEAAVGHAVNDQLQLPAVKSEKAVRSPLMDVVNAGTRLVAVGARGHILYSDNDGQDWQQADVPVSVTLTAVCFPTPQKGWAVGQDGVVLHTKDGGKRWAVQMDGLKGLVLDIAHAKSLIAAREAEVAAAAAEDKPGLERALEDMQYVAKDLQAAQENRTCCDPLMDVWFKNDREGFVVGSYGKIYRTGDGGEHWTPWWDRMENIDRLHLNAIAAARGALFIAGEMGTLYRSMDEGETWQTLASPYEGSYFGALADPTDTYVIAFGLGGNLAYSKDLGETWRHILTPAGGALYDGVIRPDGTVLMVSASGAVLTGAAADGEFVIKKKIGALWTGLAETAHGDIVLVGLGGVHQVRLDSTEAGENK